jgi:uncharacterized protein
VKMKRSNLLMRTESYLKELMAERKGDLMIAHDFNHVNRVRNWAMIIATGERFIDLETVEVTSLLHDVGLSRIVGNERKDHGPLGAEIAAEFLRGGSDLNAEDIGLIADAIRYHGLSPSIVKEHLGVLGDKGKLLEIIRDADNLDALGAIGLMRAFTSRYYLPEYDSLNIKGSAWGLSSSEFREKFGYDVKKGLAPVNNIIDQVNQQIRHYDNLHTMTAKKLGQPLVKYMKDFVIQLGREIDHQATSLKDD